MFISGGRVFLVEEMQGRRLQVGLCVHPSKGREVKHSGQVSQESVGNKISGGRWENGGPL